MAEHYQNGGLPPWAAGNGHPVNSPSLTLSNDYNPASSVNNPPLGVYSPLPNVYTPQTGTSSVTRDTFNIASGQNSGPTSLDLHELIPRKLEE